MLINIVSRRVKQLTTGGGSMGRPLIADPAGHSATEVALREIVEERFKWELLDEDDELAS